MPPSKTLYSSGRLSSRNKLIVDIIDVGQGNCILVSLPNGEFMLVDAGSQSTSLNGRAYLHAEQYINTVTNGKDIICVVLTHGDDDHTAFIPYITRAQNPTFVHYGGRIGAYSDAVETWIHSKEKTKKCNVFKYNLQSGYFNPNPDADFGSDTYDGDAHISVLAANAGFTPNDHSIVLGIKYGSRLVILPGDAESYTEDMIISKIPARILSKCNLLVPGHHGAYESTGRNWADALDPDLAIITASGTNKAYAHPAEATIDLLEEFVVSSAENHTITYSAGKGKAYELASTKDATAVTATNGDVRYTTDGDVTQIKCTTLLTSLIEREFDEEEERAAASIAMQESEWAAPLFTLATEKISAAPSASRLSIVTFGGEITTEAWDQLGRTLIPKLKSSDELSVTLNVSVRSEADTVQEFQQEISQTLSDLNLTSKIEIER